MITSYWILFSVGLQKGPSGTPVHKWHIYMQSLLIMITTWPAFEQEALIILRHKSPSKASTTALLLQVVYRGCLRAILRPSLIMHQAKSLVQVPCLGNSRNLIYCRRLWVHYKMIPWFPFQMLASPSSNEGSRLHIVFLLHCLWVFNLLCMSWVLITNW